jgi:hypothetical protein
MISWTKKLKNLEAKEVDDALLALRKETLALHQRIVALRNRAYQRRDHVAEGKLQMQLQDVNYAMEHLTDALCNHND